VASIAERVAMACVKTVVSEDKHLFIGELSMSYLSSAPISVSHLTFILVSLKTLSDLQSREAYIV